MDQKHYEKITDQMAFYLSQILPKRPNFKRYYDAQEQNYIDTLTWENCLELSVDAVITLGISAYPFYRGESCMIDRGIEMLAVCRSEDREMFHTILAVCAFEVIDQKRFAAAGIIFRDVISICNPTLEMKHILFDLPSLVPGELVNIPIEEKNISWLQIIPVSETEVLYAEENGVKSLFELLETKNVDITDLNRKSVI